MTVLEWPRVPDADRSALRSELAGLVTQVIDGEMRALDTLDDQFARMAAGLLALLDCHEADAQQRCRKCRSAQCEVLETINQYLKQPLILVWWHEFRRRGKPMPVDAVGDWLAGSETPRGWDEAPAGA
jgi:hypothetical protein